MLLGRGDKIGNVCPKGAWPFKFRHLKFSYWQSLLLPRKTGQCESSLNHSNFHRTLEEVLRRWKNWKSTVTLETTATHVFTNSQFLWVHHQKPSCVRANLMWSQWAHGAHGVLITVHCPETITVHLSAINL